MKKTILTSVGIVGILMVWFVGYLVFEFRNFGAGTLGGFDIRRFPVDKYTLENAVDSLLDSDTTFALPEKWAELDDWKKRGYDFLDTRIFYFSSPPEEMFYISFIGDSTEWAMTNYAEIAIRAVGNQEGWTLQKHTSNTEKQRIENRFDSLIIERIERMLNVKSKRED
ncbi:hypothetical protein SAMN05421823_111106 [Catalinimonas alkaloidigena]|uniref:Uncharacterized protein n=1 Tax=Catalinimonas alkaloidigena TaxID=1075417 RepID=A0A1G9REE4_9BACT|nr:hypothetical protein [Catalinimonas alkaloidigena]SDM20795.1 hypothetical protein SAMN05421823_111106 [Catalinimonas alkaloidigena]